KMKITWFGQSCFRLHYGGQIIVIDPEAAPEGIDGVELVSGADRIVRLGDGGLPAFDAEGWVPKRKLRVIDAAESVARAPVVSRIGGGLVIESGDEASVVLVSGAGDAAFGLWADDSVVIVAGDAALDAGEAALRGARVKLVALALEAGVDGAVARLRPLRGRAGLMVLEAGLALEV